MIALLLVLAAAPDAGVRGVGVRSMLDELTHAMAKEDDAKRAETLKQLEALEKKASPKEKPLLERMVKLAKDRAPPDKQLPELAAICRALIDAAKGDADTQRIAVSTYAALPLTAKNLGLDPKPYADEALALANALVRDFPDDARTHGVLASTLMHNGGAEHEVMLELKRCADLDPGLWCKAQHERSTQQYEQPRCTGANLKEAMTLTGATSHYDGKTTTYAEEPKPSLSSSDIASVTAGSAGELLMQTTPAGARALEAVTARLAVATDGAMVIKLGGKMLLGARVMERITGGSLRINTGTQAMKLDDLCKQVDRPVLPVELKLKTKTP